MVINQEKALAEKVRNDFPILQRTVNGKPLIYFDNSEASQKPSIVINTLKDYYEQYNSSVHRSMHVLGKETTEAYEGARSKLAKFINAASPQEIIFTRNATEGINLVANDWGINNLTAGDEIIISVMEHHSNIVPWQVLQQKTGVVLKFVELDENEEFNLAQFQTLLSDRTRLVSVVHLSNTLGCINPVEKIIALARQKGAKILIDTCQSLPHLPIDVQKMDCDWLVGSGYKMCGPTGIGFLYGKSELLRSIPPFLTGGEMVDQVFRNYTTYKDLPHKFEAGTPSIADAIAFGAAIDYLSEIGMDNIYAYETKLAKYLLKQLQQIQSIRVYGPQPENAAVGKLAIVIFTIEGIPAKDLSSHLDMAGIAINAGLHATQPLHEYLGIESTTRASLYFYNTYSEIDAFIVAIKEVINNS
ncbi:SufS family cysteine desulfurase [Nostoc punctiforme UO1]|uniref:SufS family cysteine desulfurase n=1 Tax=Nostoc punctiforme TaxID=272131 RepID=UPI0030986D62